MKKQMKFLTLALALFVGMTLTSCLNSDDNTTSTMSAIVKVQGSFYGTVSFVAQDGYTIEPSQESYYQTVANGIEWEQYYGKIIQLIYSYDTTSADVVIDEDGISGVTLQSLASLDSPVEISVQPVPVSDPRLRTAWPGTIWKISLYFSNTLHLTLC